MAINLADLIVESVIRDGIEDLKANPAKVDDVFSQLTQPWLGKYGSAELTRIKDTLASKNIAVVHSFHEAEAKSPCYSIQLGAENESKDRAHLSDFEEDVREEITDQDVLDSLVKTELFTPDSYDPTSGILSVDDAVDLAAVFAAYIFVDASDQEFEVLGVSTEPGNQYLLLEKNIETIDVSGDGFVKSFIHETQHEEKGDSSAVNMLIGVHSKDALLTKYMYVILKWIFKSRKNSLIRRGMVNSSFSGSDFARDLKYAGDQVFTRFFTLSGQVDDTWEAADVELIDHVEVDASPVE